MIFWFPLFRTLSHIVSPVGPTSFSNGTREVKVFQTRIDNKYFKAMLNLNFGELNVLNSKRFIKHLNPQINPVWIKALLTSFRHKEETCLTLTACYGGKY